MGYVIKSIISLLLLVLGGMIYILFRPKTLLMFSWFESLGLSGIIDKARENVSCYQLDNITLYNLPNGLWMASYIIVVSTIIPKEQKNNLLFWSLILPIISVVFEFLQIFNIIPGVFDIYDIVFYLLPLLIYLIYLKYEKAI